MALTISYRFNKKSGVVEFLSKGQSDNPRVNAALVNLSRGRTRMYRLDNLQAHNNDGPAVWDGVGVHTKELRQAYVQRVLGDIKAAIAAAEVDEFTPFVTVNGSTKFAAVDTDEDDDDEDWDEAA